MSDTAPAPEHEMLAGEYVLGTLDAREAARVEAALPQDAELAAAVGRWQRHLAPLFALMEPQAPPPGLWNRIEAALDRQQGRLPTATRPDRQPTRIARRPWPLPLWRGWAIGATAVAAGLAAILWLRPAEQAPRLTTVLLTTADQSAWIVEAADGTLHLSALNRRGAEPGRALELWALPPGASAPVSLGLVPPQGQFSVTPTRISPEPGMLIEITLEPPGGSPTGRPTGPLQFIGRLSPARSG